MNNNKTSKAFSLIELSIVILIIGVLVAAIVKGQDLLKSIKTATARSVTNSSPVNSISGITMWLEPVMEKSVTPNGGTDTADYGALVAGASWNDSRVSTDKLNLTSVGTVSYIEDGINGLPSLSFNGTDSAFLSTTATPIGTSDDSYSIAIVWSAKAKQNMSLFSQGDSTTAKSMADIVLKYTAPADPIPESFVLNFNDQATDTPLGVNAVLGVANVSIITIDDSNANNINVYNNSNTATAIASTNQGTLAIKSTDGVRVGAKIGATGTSSQFFSGLISEVIIFNKALSDREVKEVNSYLGQKYSIKISN